MSDRFEINGKWYISSKRASQLSGYTSDYIGQLARAGKVPSEMVGKARFVSESDLRAYVENQNHVSEASTEIVKKNPLAHQKEPTSSSPVSLPISSPKLLSAGAISFLVIALLLIGGYVFRGDVVLATWWKRAEPQITEISDMITATVTRMSLESQFSEKQPYEKIQKDEVETLHVAPASALALIQSGWRELNTFVDDGLTGSVETVRSLGQHTPKVQLATITVGTPRELLQRGYQVWSAFDAFVDNGLTESVAIVQSSGKYLPRVSIASPLDPFRYVARTFYTALCPFVLGSFGCQEFKETRFVGNTDVVEKAQERMGETTGSLESESVPETAPVTISRTIIERVPIVSASGVTVDDIQLVVNNLRDELIPLIDAAARSPQRSSSSNSPSSSGDFLPLTGGTLTGALTGTSATLSGALSSATLAVSASTTFNGVEYLFPSGDGADGQVLSTDGAGSLTWETVSGGGGSDTNWAFFNGSGIRLATTTNQVLIGASSTTTSQTLEVIGSGYFSGSLGLGTTSPASSLDVWGDVRIGTSPTPLLFADVSSGRIGIGTTSPYAKLSVVGPVVAEYFTATSTTATSTFAGGIDLSGGCFAIDGTCVGGGGTPGGSDTQLQYNNGGSFGGIADLTYDGSNLTIGASDATTQLILPQSNDAATPTLAFGDGDTGFFEASDDLVRYTAAGSANIVFRNGFGLYTVPSGSASGPALAVGGSDNGLYKISTGRLGFAVSGNHALELGTTRAKFLDGSVSVPSLSFGAAGSGGDDTDTGFWHPGADTVALSTAGSERFRVDSSGNFGIGTTSSYAKLSVVGETVAEYFTATSTTATSTFSGNAQVLGTFQVGTGSIYLRDNATSTFAGGIDLSGGCFAINGACVGGGGGGGTPGGSDTQLQYNNGGSFGGATGITWDDSGELLTIQSQNDSSSEEALRLQGPDRATAANNDEVYLSFYNETSSGFAETARIVSQTNANANPAGHLYFQLADASGGLLTALELDRAGGDTQIRLPDTGSEGRPTLTFQGNDNDGFFLVSNGMVGYSSNGTEIVRFQPRGIALDDVTLGSTNGTGVFALFNGTAPTASATNGAILYSADIAGTAGNAGLGILTESGTVHTFGTNVGFGTSSPSEALHVDAGSGDAFGLFETTSDNQAGFKFKTASYDWLAGIHGGAGGSFKVSAGTAFGTNDFLVVEDDAGFLIGGADAEIDAFGSTGLDIDYRTKNSHRFYVDSNNTSSGEEFAVYHDSETAETSPLFVIQESGVSGFATTSPWRTLSVTGTVAFDGLTTAGATEDALCLTSGGEVVVNTGAADCTVSSARFKENITSLTTGLDDVLALRPVSFTYINGEEDDVHIGLIAEEVQKIEPRLVFSGEDGRVRGVRYNEMVALLVRAIQQLSARLDALAERVGNGIAAVVESLTVGSSESPAGITLYDELTGEPYCLSVRNGRTVTRAGICGQAKSTTTTTRTSLEASEENDVENISATTTPDIPEGSTENASTTSEIISDSGEDTPIDSEEEISSEETPPEDELVPEPPVTDEAAPEEDDVENDPPEDSVPEESEPEPDVPAPEETPTE